MRADSYLSAVDYPGRIILAGCDSCRRPVLAYALTGRSRSSMNRMLVSREDGIRTEALDGECMGNPLLTIYRAVAKSGSRIICSNGLHTETIIESLAGGQSLSDALSRMEAEPDPPIWTPRIAAVVEEDGSCSISIARKDGGDDVRLLYSYDPEPGWGHMIHTYAGDVSCPLPFKGLPVRVSIAGCTAAMLWEAMPQERRIALYMLSGGEERIINAHGGEYGEDRS